MAITTYAGWLADGSPVQTARCVADFAATLRGHGYTVYTLGDIRHLQADPPEDHCPYSNTPWPGVQPYPHVMALDVMPGGALDWRALGWRIVADKLAGVAGTEWIKYVNWTDAAGHCWHDKWQPGHVRTSSSDTGHIHISARTDYVNTGTGYDPVAAILGGTMADPVFDHVMASGQTFATDHNQIWGRVRDSLAGGGRLDQALEKLDGLALAVEGLAAGVGPTQEQVDAAVAKALADPAIQSGIAAAIAAHFKVV